MRVPFLDLKRQYEAIAPEVQQGLEAVIGNTRFILGQEVGEFEQAFASYSECEAAIGVASGLDALRLSLRVLDIGAGDEVITAANTFIATALAISSVGAKPVLVDADPQTYNIDPAKIEAAITERTRAIMPVHLYGQPAEMTPILDVAVRHGLKVIEDASQAHGALYRGRRVGGLGDLGAFSLYPGKNLGAYGDAGVITTNDPELVEKLRMLRNYGCKSKYEHVVAGENSRLDTLQAVVLNAKLRRLDGWNESRRSRAARYAEKLRGVGDLVLPATADGVVPVYHLFVVQTARRDELMVALKEAEIDTIIHYPKPIHLQDAYAAEGWKRGDFPVTEYLAERIVSLPIYAELEDAQIDHVAEAAAGFFAEATTGVDGRDVPVS